MGTLRIKVRGKSSHWSQRERGVDAISVAARIITAIEDFNNTYASSTPFVVGVGTIAGGTRTSIIADCVEMTCTLRAASRDEQNKIFNLLNQKFQKVASENNAVAAVELNLGSPPVNNDPQLIKLARKIGEEIFGRENVVIESTMPLGGDDAGFLFREVSGVKLSFCAGFKDRENYPLHSPRFDFDEQVIPLALRTLYSVVLKMPHATTTHGSGQDNPRAS